MIMRIFLFLMSGAAFLAGAAILMDAESAIHEIEAFILFVCFSVLFSGAAIVDAIYVLPTRTGSR